MRWTRPESIPWPLLLALAGLGLALTARGWLDYPRCPSDEGNWIAILHRLDAGISWPVSGPAYVWGLQRLGWPYETSVPLLGTLGATLLPPALYGLYRLSGLARGQAAGSVAWLLVSSYFLAPLLESRPQQWGMGLVVAAFVLFQRLERKVSPGAGGGFLLLYGMTFFTHLLSFIVLNGLLAVRLLLAGSRQWRAPGYWIFGLLVCLGILLDDDGPYRAMYLDLRRFHLRALAWPWVLGGGLAALGGGVWIGRCLPALQAACRRLPLEIWFAFAGGGLLGGALGQAWLAPPQYLAPYQGELWRFFWVQSGNLLFAGTFLYGLWWRVRQDAEDALSPWLAAALSLMVLGGMVLLVSPWLGDKNGMIRAVNYWMLFAAPIAWQGLRQTPPRVRGALAVLGPLGGSLSLAHAVKLEWVLSC